MTKENHPLRIGIDGRVLQDNRPSGIPSYAYHTIKEILKIDKTNEYVIFYNSFKKLEGITPSFEGNVSTKTYHYPNKILEWLWRIFPYPKIDKILDVDIFFSPHFINIPLSKKVKKIVTIHDLSFVKYKEYFSHQKNIWHWQMNPRKICREFDKIIAVSQATKNDLVDIYKVPANKIRVIHNGAVTKEDQNTTKTKENEILGKYNIAEKDYILFLATLEPRKNIEGLIEAFQVIKAGTSQKLVIAGKKGWLFDTIFEKVKKYGIENRIVFTDFVTEEEKYVLLKNCSVFVFPSFCEGFGIPIIEAKNHLVPIITSSCSSMPEIIRDSAILVNPHNIIDLADAIKNVLRDSDLQKKLQQKEGAVNNLSWKESAQKTLDCILN